jgi:hypothetical protein
LWRKLTACVAKKGDYRFLRRGAKNGRNWSGP